MTTTKKIVRTLICWSVLPTAFVASSSHFAPQRATVASTPTTKNTSTRNPLNRQHDHHHPRYSRPTFSKALELRGGAVGKGASPATASSTSSSSSSSSSVASSSALLLRLKIGFYFGLWYALNVYYNIVNKKVLNVLPLPLIVGSLQFGIGCFYVLLLWLLRLRPCPSVSSPPVQVSLASVGFWHCAGQLLSMVSLGAGPVSFTHIVKALEPFFSAAVSALWLHQYMAWPVYLTLVPVVGGVGYACLKERQFSWLAFWMAMGSNVAFAFRAVLSKAAMTTAAMATASSKNLTSTNIFGIVTILAFIMSIPIGLLGEGPTLFWSKWNEATTAHLVDKVVEVVKYAEESQTHVVEKVVQQVTTPAATTCNDLIKAIVVSGLFHYLNNEVMYLALDNVHPITLAVGNTMKRVFIMVASILVFRNPISIQAAIGSAIGIGGVLLYSLTKQHYEQTKNSPSQAPTPATKLAGKQKNAAVVAAANKKSGQQQQIKNQERKKGK